MEAEKQNQSLVKERISIKSFFSGKVLQNSYVFKQRWFILFLFALSVLYIFNRYRAETTYRKGVRLRQALTDRRAEYVTKSSDLMRMSKRSEILKQVEKRNIGLKESVNPPYWIAKQP